MKPIFQEMASGTRRVCVVQGQEMAGEPRRVCQEVRSADGWMRSSRPVARDHFIRLAVARYQCLALKQHRPFRSLPAQFSNLGASSLSHLRRAGGNEGCRQAESQSAFSRQAQLSPPPRIYDSKAGQASAEVRVPLCMFNYAPPPATGPRAALEPNSFFQVSDKEHTEQHIDAFEGGHNNTKMVGGAVGIRLGQTPSQQFPDADGMDGARPCTQVRAQVARVSITCWYAASASNAQQVGTGVGKFQRTRAANMLNFHECNVA